MQTLNGMEVHVNHGHTIRKRKLTWKERHRSVPYRPKKKFHIWREYIVKDGDVLQVQGKLVMNPNTWARVAGQFDQGVFHG